MNRRVRWILNPESRSWNCLTRLNEEGVTIVMITHDAKIASYAKRVIRIIDGEIEEAAE